MGSDPINLTEQRKLQSALTYAGKYGWRVFPVYEAVGEDCSCSPSSPTRRNRPEGKEGTCGSPGKHPRTKNGWKDATTDEGTIRAWWGKAPDANIAVDCGGSGLLVLDIDPRNGGDATLKQLVAELGALPDGPRAKTGGGGWHYFFQLPRLDFDVKIVAALGSGVDVKAGGGYVLLAPSNHVRGEYGWLVDNRPKPVKGEARMLLPPLPPGWLDRILKRVKVTTTGSTGPVTEGLLGAAFQAAGDGWWSGVSPKNPDMAIVRCPWEDQHTSGTRFDGSTVVWAPTAEYGLGCFDCKHAHCAGRTYKDVLAALPSVAVEAARAKVPGKGITREDIPPPEDDDEPGGGGGGGGDDESWLKGLDCKSDGSVKDTAGNAALILLNGAEWRGVLQYNAFSDQVTFVRPAPHVPGYGAIPAGTLYADQHGVLVQHLLSKRRQLKLGLDLVHQAVRSAAHRNTIDPLVATLDALRWDGTKRLMRWTVTYLGAEDCVANEVMGALWLIGAVARAYAPGCQMDSMLVLSGDQGEGKSSVGRLLCPDPAWHLGSLPNLQDLTAAKQAIQGKWIVEVAELDALKGSSMTRVKDFLTQVGDTYRAPYDRFNVTHPRRCVFLGTTNETQFLTDPTGARRFLPLIGRLTIDRERLEADAPQLLAEAIVEYRQGTPWWLSPQQERELFGDAREARYQIDPWEDLLEAAVGALTQVSTAALYDAVGMPKDRRDRRSMERVVAIMHRLGWEPARIRPNYPESHTQVRGWAKKR